MSKASEKMNHESTKVRKHEEETVKEIVETVRTGGTVYVDPPKAGKNEKTGKSKEEKAEAGKRGSGADEAETVEP